MVQAILDGRKTQTRRILKDGTPLGNFKETIEHCRYGKPGGGLWVRETVGRVSFMGTYLYKTDPIEPGEIVKWRPSIHMPKAACRIFLEITSITIERIQDISEGDAIAEGIEYIVSPMVSGYRDYLTEKLRGIKSAIVGSPRESYKSLWQSINGEQSWGDNPWVWVIEFQRVELK